MTPPLLEGREEDVECHAHINFVATERKVRA